MITYYFNDTVDDKGRHEVHERTCSYIPGSSNRTEIGIYSNCHEAIQSAAKSYPWKEFDGCYWCSRECHKG